MSKKTILTNRALSVMTDAEIHAMLCPGKTGQYDFAPGAHSTALAAVERYNDKLAARNTYTVAGDSYTFSIYRDEDDVAVLAAKSYRSGFTSWTRDSQALPTTSDEALLRLYFCRWQSLVTLPSDYRKTAAKPGPRDVGALSICDVCGAPTPGYQLRRLDKSYLSRLPYWLHARLACQSCSERLY